MLESGLGGRVCLVTGAGNGIGRATAELLAGEGARLALCDNDAEALDAALPAVVAAAAGAVAAGAGVAGAGAAGPAADPDPLCLVADLSHRDGADHVLAATRERFGRLDVLIHCAGIYRVTPLPEVTDDEWDRVLDVNLRSSFLLAQGAVELMREHADGRIVLFGSFAARTGGLRASAPYAASKAGVEGLSRHVAQYAGPLGVRVNCLHPGFTVTPMTSILGAEARAEAVERSPLRRHCGPEEQARMAVVLASDLAAFVHGATLDVNGGMYMA